MPENITAWPFGAAGAADAAGTWPSGGAAPGTTSSTTKGQGVTAQGSTAEYWLPIWSGEILRAYDQYNIFEPLVTTRQIASGTTMRFPITGTVSHKAVWGAGEELTETEGIDAPQFFDISLDQRPMASYFELDDISLMLTQWEYRSELARQAGLALANARDKQIACLIAQGAFMASRSPAVSKGGNFAHPSTARNAPGTIQTIDYTDSTVFDMPADVTFNCLGNTTSSVTNRTNAALKLLEYIERYMVRLQEIDGPTDGVYVSVTPQAFNDIRALGLARPNAVGTANTQAANMQPMFGGVAEAGGLGAGYTTGMNSLSDTLEYMGATIVKTNHMLEQTVKQGAASAWSLGSNGGAASGQAVDYDLHDVILDASNDGAGSTEIGAAGASGTRVTRIHDLGDAKYDFDWVNFGDGGDGADAGAIIMNPVKALIWQKDAVASLSLQGMKVDTIQDVRRNTNFTVASRMSGGGVLRPELCAAILGHGAGAA